MKALNSAILASLARAAEAAAVSPGIDVGRARATLQMRSEFLPAAS
jgi:hypothetical protein